MKILMVAAEMLPFLRTSDVATVVTGLSQALQKLGHDVRIVIPRYRTLQFAATIKISPVIDAFDIPLYDYASQASLSRLDYEGLPVYLLENQTYFGRDDPYGYLDDYERFIFFTRAIVEMLSNDAFAREGWYPEIIHGHDWICGLLPMWIRHSYKDFFTSHPVAFVYTIHNASFPGRFGHRALSIADLTELGIFRSIGENESSISFMARGILAADAVNTVSQQHAQEILQEEYTRDLAQALLVSKKEIRGILNGLDYTTYNPAFDESIAYRYDRDRLHLRRENKRLLQEECGLTVNPTIPLLGFISRLIPEKGADLLEEILPPLLKEEGVQVILVGVVGDYHYLEVFTRMQEEYHTQFISFFTALDDPLSRKLLASADMMLIPVLREPCGLQQMLSMRYGAVPVAHLTGGLTDTVASWSASTSLDIGKGFVFDLANRDAFLSATRAALCLYNTDQQMWQELQRHNMKVEFLWHSAASKYVELYKQALKNSQRHITLPLLQQQYELTQPDQWDLLVQSILEGSELTATIVDRNVYLHQVARSIRELLNGDAVLIWTPDEMDPQLFHPEGYSFRHARTSSNGFHPEQYPLYAERDSRSWQYIHSLVPKKGIANSELGFLSSGLAQQHGWVMQMSMPMRTHGVFLGKIDVFTCHQTRDFSEREMSLLRAFTTALAVNIENADFSKLAERLFEADRQMAQAQTVDEIAHCALRHAKSLTRAAACHLYAQLGQDVRSYTLAENVHFTQHAIYLTPATLTGEATDGPRANEENANKLHARRSSRLHARLINSSNQDMGEIVAIKSRPIAFSRHDDTILQSLARQVATFLQAAFLREKEDKSRVDQLRKLADSLFGGVDFNTLLQKVLATIADVLQSKAASLYLMNAETNVLEIRAAHGNHDPLLQKKVNYQLGEGITGWIAKQGKTFRADSPEQLRANPQWIGKHKHLHGNVDPNAFLGIPLKATDLVNPEQQTVIGVLKLEDREDDTIFTLQDERLGEMMANVIATVIQNERLSNRRLLELNANLQQFSKAMVGDLEMSVLVKRIVDTIAEVVGADASALYLIEPGSDVLKIRAATGYQEALVPKKTKYEIHGLGVTAWIAREGKSFNAKNATDLRKHPNWAGKYKHLHGDVDPNAFLGIPLKIITTDGYENTIGVLKVEGVHPSSRHPEEYFTEQDQLLVEMMGNVIATVIQNARLSDTRLRELNANLRTLSEAMVGGLEMSVLVKRTVDTITEVVGADASALYLIEPGSDMLKIRAATGYQAALVQEETYYEVHGRGVTAWIAREGKPFNARNAIDLRRHPSWAGKYKRLHGNVDPNAFLGIPLKIITTGGREEIIGVLKVEGVHPSSRHPEEYFTEQDQLLVEMMGNVIATVIQNTRLSDTRLRELNVNLRALSEAMVGGLEMSVLVKRTVDTITEVVGANASALYLIEPGSDLLKIRAATGYQAALVQEETYYEVHGRGVTAWIAREGKLFNAKNAADLQKHPNWAGRYKYLHGNVDPNAFLGIPLKIITTGGREEIIGVLKVEGVHPSSRHPEAYFTEQDQLLVEMMGNVITTVIQNTRLSDTRLLELRQVIVECITSVIPTPHAGSDRSNVELIQHMMSGVVDILGPSAALDTLQSFVHSTDTTVLEALSRTLLSSFSHKGPISPQEQLVALLNQTQLLLSFNPNPLLFRIFATQSEDEEVRRWYNSTYQLYHSKTTNRAKLLDALQLASLWQEARESARLALPERFRQATKGLAAALASIANKNAELVGEVGLWTAFKLPDITAFTELHLPSHLPLLFFRGLQVPSQDDLNSFRLLLQQLQREGLGHIVSIVSLLPATEADQFSSSLRQQMKTLVVDSLFLTLEDMQRIVSSTDPRGILISLLLKQVNLLTLSPYKTSGPTDRKMFYGRAIELRDISEHIVSRSYAIIGGRRVGKSSLLILLHQHNLPDAGIRSLYHDCSTSATYEEFMQAPLHLWQTGEIRKDLPTTFRELLLNPPEDKPLVLLLDEADKLIPADRECDWSLFKKLRSLINSGQGNIVLSGERTLRKALEDASSPLYNFAETKVLGPLDYQAVEGLITVPMKQLEIKLTEEKAIVDMIWEATDGHPNVVQRICDRLIALLNKRGTRQITPGNVHDILNTPDFQERDFLSTYWEQASELEKLITLLMVRNGDMQFTRARIVYLLEENALAVNEQAVKDALTNLDTLRSILRRSQDGYSFAFKFFPQVLTNMGVDELFHAYKKMYLDREADR